MLPASLKSNEISFSHLVSWSGFKPSQLPPLFRKPPTFSMATNNPDAAIPANPAPSVALTQFTRFPRLPPELRLRIWNLGLQEPRIIPLRLFRGHSAFTGFSQPWKPFLQASRESRHEAQKHVKTLGLVDRHSHPAQVPGEITLDMANDIFMLQVWGQQCRSPEIFQREAYEIERRMYYLQHRGWPQPAPFDMSMFQPARSLFIPFKSDVGNSFSIAYTKDELPVAVAKIENIAVQLSLPPFNWHFGTEDDWFDHGGDYFRGFPRQ